MIEPRRYLLLGLDSLSFAITKKLLFLWIRIRTEPAIADEIGLTTDTPVLYALDSRSLANRLVLAGLCKRMQLPSSEARLAVCDLRERRALFWVREPPGLLSRRGWRRPAQAQLERVIEAVRKDAPRDIQIVPVSIFWGRSPDRQRNFMGIALSDTWTIAGRLKRTLAIAVHGRNTYVQFSQPVSVRELCAELNSTSQAARKTARLLRVHFNRLRTAVVGPDLSHRRTFLDSLMHHPTLRMSIGREAREQGIRESRAERRARRYLDEIAADYSYAVIRMLERLLGWLWTRIYDGVECRHLDTLRSIAPGNEIVYLPCHRSHFDYLLLSYLVHRAGLVPPHIAAGVNLNLPLVGSVLRRGGAFFLRRSFRDNQLYATAFGLYFQEMLVRGFSVEYFIEGGRSRTGRLLQPKPGLLAMTVNSYLKSPLRSIVLLPVHIGYERIFEGRSYTSELSGKPKRKESVGALLRAIASLRGKFGKVTVSFGEPVKLNEYLDAHQPGWRAQRGAADQRPDWLPGLVNRLGREVLTRVNACAAVNPVNLVALVMLSTPRQAIAESDLVNQLNLCTKLLGAVPYSSRVTTTGMSAQQMIAHVESLGLLSRHRHPLGDLLLLEGDLGTLMTYYRNSILHLFALPSFVAICFINNRRLSVQRITEFGALAYPYVRGELFLRWSKKEFTNVMDQTIRAMLDLGLLRWDVNSEELCSPDEDGTPPLELSLLAQAVRQTFERFYITGALLVRSGSGRLTRAELEKLCRLTAERLALLYGFKAPEFFDQTLFTSFVGMLERAGVLHQAEDGTLVFDASVQSIYQDAKLILSRPVRQSIDQLAGIGLKTSAQENTVNQ